MTARARTIFLGTGEFALPILETLAGNPEIELSAVVTAPPRTGSRGREARVPVAAWAEAKQVPALRPERLRTPDAIDAIRSLRPDLLVLADYGQIVPGALLDEPAHGALNVHPSLLPRHRGATPVPATILAGDSETGVTLMRMDAGLDTGPVVAQWRHALNGRETTPELEAALAQLGARLLDASLAHWLGGKIEPEPQDEAGATLTRVLRRPDGRIDPTLSATLLERQVRAYQPWPGSYFESTVGRLSVWRAEVGQPRLAREIGALVPGDKAALALVTADALLELHEVQPAGGRRMSSADLVRGRPGWHGARTESPAETRA